MRKLILGLLVSLILVVTGCGQHIPQPRAVNGIMDLSAVNLAPGPVMLNGEWGFAFNCLLPPDDPFWTKNKGMISLPGLWQGQTVDGIALPPQGYGTYRLKIIHLPPDLNVAALHIPDILSVGRVWINGKPVAAGGVVGTEKSRETPEAHTLISTFSVQENAVDLLIQVSNFHNTQGGINMPIWFGYADAIQEKVSREWILTAVMGSALLLIGLFHLTLFGIGRTEKVHAYFGLYCLAWAVQIIFSAGGGCLGAFMFKDLPWRLSIDLTLLAYALSPPLMIMFYHALFPNSWGGPINKVFQISATVFLAYLLLTPPNAFDPICFWYFLLTLIGFAYLFIRFVADLIGNRPGIWILVPGFLLLIFTILNDLLKDLHIVQNEFIFSYGLFGFILSYSFLIFLRLSKAFTTIRELSFTLKEKNEALSKLDQLKDQLLANTSHELKTPLNGIMGMAQSFTDLSLPPNVTRGLVIIEASARRLLSLINDLLDLSQLKNKDLTLTMSSVSLNPVVDSVLLVMAQFIKDRPVVFENLVPEEFPSLMCDENRLHQILFNLVGNSIKFTEHGKISVRASIHEKQARIAVRDTGIGIAKDLQERIFQAFEQGGKGVNDTHRGTGLGLAITRDLVTLNGGSIGVESQQGNGSTFWFTIPLWPEEKPKIHAQGSRLEKQVLSRFPDPDLLVGHMDTRAMSSGGRTLILAVDDDPINLQVVANHLEGNNMDVVTATRGEDALVRLAQNPLPDLVLLDVMMPGLSGHETCNRIREHHSPSELPVILLTAKHRIQDLLQGFSSGANDYLTKPFEKKELMARIKTQLRLKQAYHALKENAALKKELQARKKRENLLKLTQIQLSGMLNTVEDAVLAVNPGKEIGFSNKAFESITGLASEQLLGQNFLTLFPDQKNPSLMPLTRCMDSTDPTSLPLEHPGLPIKGRNNTVITVDVTLRRLAINGEDFCFMIFKRHGQDEKDPPRLC